MKILWVIIPSMIVTSCQRTDRSKLIGTWRIADIQFEYLQQQEDFMNEQMQMLQDSLAVLTDSARATQYQEQLQFAQERLHELQASRDSLFKNRWIFHRDGTFEARETDGTKSGLWSYDPQHRMLFTVIDKQTSSVDVRFRKDTLMLQFDSLNYLSFVRSD